MDRTDRTLLALLQEDCTLSIAQLAERVNLSATPCWKRIQRLEADGVIERRVALVNPEQVGLERFAAAVAAMPEVMEAHRMAGDVDYMLRVVTTDLRAYDAFYKRLITAVAPKNVSSRMSMERVKATTALPLPVATPRARK